MQSVSWELMAFSKIQTRVPPPAFQGPLLAVNRDGIIKSRALIRPRIASSFMNLIAAAKIARKYPKATRFNLAAHRAPVSRGNERRVEGQAARAMNLGFAG